jgi:hypothetical protein
MGVQDFVLESYLKKALYHLQRSSSESRLIDEVPQKTINDYRTTFYLLYLPVPCI